MRKALLLAVMLCAGLAPHSLRAQAADTLPRRPSQAAEITGGILGSAAGLVAGSLIGFGAELSYLDGDCFETSGCGGGALAGAAIGSTLGAAGGAYLGGKLARHDVSFMHALGGATLGLVIFGGLTAVGATLGPEVAVPIAITIPLGQGFLAGGFAQRRPRRD